MPTNETTEPTKAEVMDNLAQVAEAITIALSMVRTGDLDGAAETLGDVCQFDSTGTVEKIHAAIRELDSE